VAELDIVDRHLTRMRPALAPDPGLRERVRARLTESNVTPPPARATGTAGWRAVRATGKAGIGVAMSLLGLGFIGGYFSRPTHDAPPPVAPQGAARAASSTAAPSPPPAARRADLDALDPLDEQRAVSEAHGSEAGASAPRPSGAAASAPMMGHEPRPHAHSPRQRSAPASRNEELALLARAERAVRAKDSALALALGGELDERYPRSTLLEERRAIELMAYCQAGASDARARAERFLRAHPSSVYGGRIRELCPTEPTANGVLTSADKSATSGH
jgi:hypothetical protein